MNKFNPNVFFDLTEVSFKEIFEGEENVWEVVKKISSYLEECFSRDKLKGNFAKNVYVEKGVSIDPTAKILGPAFIGVNSKIGFNSLLRENVIVGENSEVGHGAGVEVKNSIILNNTILSHYSYTGDSILGSNVNLGGGAILANFRFDILPISLHLEDGTKVETKMNKLGAILGDGCKIGANAVLNPGTILGKNSIVYPLKYVGGVFPPNSKIK